MGPMTYNKIRRILFSVANNPSQGFSLAYDWMEQTYRKKLDVKSYRGLMAGLKFYEKHQREFRLTVAGDTGEHADFAGTFGSTPTRFDVTTNTAFKKFSDYEPFLGDNIAYKIALLDQTDFRILDVFDLAFPCCAACGGYLIPAVVLLDQNHNRRGEPQLTNDQILVDVCARCNSYIEKERYTHYGLFSTREIYDAIDDNGSGNFFALSLVEQHLSSTYKYLRRQYSDYLMALGSHRYRMTEPKGEGYWTIYFDFKNRAVSCEIPEEIACSHEI